METCEFPGCGRRRYNRKPLCQGHDKQQRKGEPLRRIRPRAEIAPDPFCAVEGCDRPYYGRGLCGAHWQQDRKGKPLTPITQKKRPGERCEFPDCGRPQTHSGLCISHIRMKARGKPLAPVKDTRQVPDGTRKPTQNGYIRIKMRSHPNVTANGWMGEHTYVMSQMLGRPLLPGENVHHKNGVRHDNRPENLELWVVLQPPGQRPEDLVEHAREILARYG